MNRTGNWMQTATGKQFWPLDPRPADINIEDIARALSKICRFNGHCAYFYSVAQHSVYVSWQVPRELALYGLLHDATEAYIGDMTRPLKEMIPQYREIENGIWEVIAERFHLAIGMPAEVKAADNNVLLAEQTQLMLPPPQRWSVPGIAAPIKISQWGCEQAYHAFISRFLALGGNLA